MKKSLSVIVSLFIVMLIMTAVKTGAVEQKESIGKTSFYGNYEYAEEDEYRSVDTNPSHLRHSDNPLVTGLSVLPRTGENLQPIYTQIGFILLSVLAILMIHIKRKTGD